jgi:transposase-like protein
MARVAKAEHARIHRMVEVEKRKVADVAAEFGCTAPTIYAIVSKLRRNEASPVIEPGIEPGIEEEAAPAGPVPAESVAAPAVDLFSAAPVRVAPPRPAASAPPAPPPSVIPTPSAAPVARLVEKSAGVGNKLAKPGFGFHMRTADGEESVAPYRSLEDLLSAAKNVLRSAARSSEPVWFSIQPLDLATVDSEAA